MFHEVARKLRAAGFTKGAYIRHDVISAVRRITGKSSFFKHFNRGAAAAVISRGKASKVIVRHIERHGSGVLQRSGRAYRQKIVNLTNRWR